LQSAKREIEADDALLSMHIDKLPRTKVPQT
jgi:hypothetical protein